MTDQRHDETEQTPIIAADMPIRPRTYPIRELLGAFRDLIRAGESARLVFAGRRDRDEIYSFWNDVDRMGIADHVEFHPYYTRCDRFGVKKQDAAVWIPRTTPGAMLTADYLRKRLAGWRRGEPSGAGKYALFFTSFQPEKHEGNSTLMRIWLDHLRACGYKIHVAYYTYDLAFATADMRRKALRKYDLYREIPVASKLVGSNYDGLNLHVDDWCGEEALEAVAEMTARFEYDVAIVNYSFMSAVFDMVSAYTKKILLTHDNFVDRNRRLLAQGYAESAWMSTAEAGERLACSRADEIVALQAHEAEFFRTLTDRPERVRVVGPLVETSPLTAPNQTDAADTPAPQSPIRIGYFGSSNWVNEQNYHEFLKLWFAHPTLRERSRLLVGGGVCETLAKFVPQAMLDRAGVELVGRVDRPSTFFDLCDVQINPEIGGTGVKIKTVEAMAHGCALVTTKAGSIGIENNTRYLQADNFAELVDRLAEIAEDPSRLVGLRSEIVAAYATYAERQRRAMSDLLGSPPAANTASEPAPTAQQTASPAPLPGSSVIAEGLPAPKRKGKLRYEIPAYVRDNAAPYHFEEFEQVLRRTDIRGKRVFEVGSDYHLASARLFAANGAAKVVATNLAPWKSDEPLPPGVEFRTGDAALAADLEPGSFDIIYGIAILEHIPDYAPLVATLRRLLADDGVAYLQGCPLWPGTLGHHVYYAPDDPNFEATFAAGGGTRRDILYSFTGNNPIPHWSHLALEPEELIDLLKSKGIDPRDAEGMVRYIFNQDGTMQGSCSNYLSASEVLGHLTKGFNIAAERIWSEDEPNAYFQKALRKYSESDLRTLGLRVWATPSAVVHGSRVAILEPKVSIVIPFYNVEAYIEACLESVVNQDYEDIEVILVDDCSPDASRAVAERYAARDERVRLITHDVNRGLGPARNTGAAAATGAFIMFLDSDDLLASRSAVRQLVEASQTSGCPVVVGSAEQLQPDGSIDEYDRLYDRHNNGCPGEIVEGEVAYLGASFIPGGRYVPMRAWGTLIDRVFYTELALDFPPGRHEDLPHTPFLYYAAGRVYYAPEIVVTYRNRGESLSTKHWGRNELAAYVGTWAHIRANIVRFGLDHQMGNTAVKTAEHLVMKLRMNGAARGLEDQIIDTVAQILEDAGGPLDHNHFFYAMDAFRAVLDLRKYDFDLFRKLTRHIDSKNMIAYYRKKLNEGVRHHGAITFVDAPAEVEVKPPTVAQADSVHDNEARVRSMMRAFDRLAPAHVKAFPSMLTDGDRAIYFRAGCEYRFEGTIVDAGCFVGGTTSCLVAGLLANPRLQVNDPRLAGLIRVYDLFQIDDDYILHHLRKNYPAGRFEPGGSFLEQFRTNLADHVAMLDIRPGDVTAVGYPDATPIEILGVDLCKALPVTDHLVREFFPRLLPSALVIQQDYIHAYHPHIHLSMARLSDCFKLDTEIRWGGSFAFRCVRPITAELVRKRFGDDQTWYDDRGTNVPLLRSIAEDSLYDENRWVLLQVLAVYHWSLGDHDAARAIFREACERYPAFVPDERMQEIMNQTATIA